MDTRVEKFLTEFPDICTDKKIEDQDIDSMKLMMIAFAIEDLLEEMPPQNFWTMSILEIFSDVA